jgi:hypothetical protein
MASLLTGADTWEKASLLTGADTSAMRRLSAGQRCGPRPENSRIALAGGFLRKASGSALGAQDERVPIVAHGTRAARCASP